ncbi:MAG: hypothetical protein FJW79_06845 [Actinobacteria bacterium]|nr:hypothetical protein [Actinomycetota bacterium]
MPTSRTMVALVLTALLAAACAGTEGNGGPPVPDPDLTIERQVGYAVVVDQTGGRTLIGFNADRNATSGDSYDVTQAVWRVEAGPWNEPPVTCLAVGKRLELGISKVQNASQPGLLKSRVIWLSCLAPAD